MAYAKVPEVFIPSLAVPDSTLGSVARGPRQTRLDARPPGTIPYYPADFHGHFRGHLSTQTLLERFKTTWEDWAPEPNRALPGWIKKFDLKISDDHPPDLTERLACLKRAGGNWELALLLLFAHQFLKHDNRGNHARAIILACVMRMLARCSPPLPLSALLLGQTSPASPWADRLDAKPVSDGVREFHNRLFAYVSLLFPKALEGNQGHPAVNWEDPKHALESLDEVLLCLKEVLQAGLILPFDDAYVTRGILASAFGDEQWARWEYAFLSGRETEGSPATMFWECGMNLRADKKTDAVEKAWAGYKDLAELGRGSGVYTSWLGFLPNFKVFKGSADDAWEPTIRFLAQNPQYGFSGVDVCAPENFEYQPAGFEALLKVMLGAAPLRIQALRRQRDLPPGFQGPLVLRPHVGEGSGAKDAPLTWMPMFDAQRFKSAVAVVWQKVLGASFELEPCIDALCGTVERAGSSMKPPAEVERISRANLGTVLDVLNRHADAPGALNLLVRLGHGTHITEDQARKIKQLGVGVDVNLNSNIRTGSIIRHDMPDPVVNLDKVDERWRRFYQPRKAQSRWVQSYYHRSGQDDWSKFLIQHLIDYHSLRYLVQQGVPVYLSSDGEGVELSRMDEEYFYAELFLKHACLQGLIPKAEWKQKDSDTIPEYVREKLLRFCAHSANYALMRGVPRETAAQVHLADKKAIRDRYKVFDIFYDEDGKPKKVISEPIHPLVKSHGYSRLSE